jgi:glucokinase
MKIVAGDIGGTHARFALAELAPGAPPALGPMHRYRTREHAGIASAWATFQRDSGGSLPAAAALGIAAPIEGEVLRFVNSAWEIGRHSLAGELGLDRLLLLNDFGAVAHAVAALPASAFAPLAGPATGLPADGVTTVIGPGTGLGVSTLIRRGGQVTVVETESAHIAFAPQSPEDAALEKAVRARYGRCSVERIVSGPGLLEILANLRGEQHGVLEPGAVWEAALAGHDPQASQALDLLVACFGAAAGDISLAHGSTSVVITGGLAARMRERLASPLFHARFVNKGRYRPRMERIPVMLCTEPEPGLFGAAVAFQRTILSETAAPEQAG